MLSTLAFTAPSLEQSKWAVGLGQIGESRPSTRNVRNESDELVSLLVGYHKAASVTEEDRLRIDDLVSSLIEARVSFDPKECLDGPLYVSYVQAGPPPLWATLGLGKNNLQGQQYWVDDAERGNSVINYAEIFGKAFHIRAYGTFEPDNNVESSETSTSPFGAILSLFGGVNPVPSKKLVQCPADYTVKVKRGSFVFGSRTLDIPIAGTGYLRVLYADSRVRIFVSPEATTDDRWEKAGLIVVQLRVDLVDPSFELEVF